MSPGGGVSFPFQTPRTILLKDSDISLAPPADAILRIYLDSRDALSIECVPMDTCVDISGHLGGYPDREIHPIIARAGIFIFMGELKRPNCPVQSRSEQEVSKIRTPCTVEMGVAEADNDGVTVVIA